MSKAVPWILGVLFAAAMGANILWAWRSMHKPEEKPEEKHEEAKRLSHDAEGNPVLKIDAISYRRSISRSGAALLDSMSAVPCERGPIALHTISRLRTFTGAGKRKDSTFSASRNSKRARGPQLHTRLLLRSNHNCCYASSMN